MHSRRDFLALGAAAAIAIERESEGDERDGRIAEAAANLCELIRPRPKAFFHYNLNAFDIWVAATHLQIAIREAGLPARWRRQYRIAGAVAKDMSHAPWDCYAGCRHHRQHEFIERIIDSGEDARYDTEIVA